jgi:hypothetical protein
VAGGDSVTFTWLSGIRVSLNGNTGPYLGEGAPNSLVQIPLADITTARIFVGAPRHQNFTSASLVATVYAASHEGTWVTWNAIGTTTLRAGLSFHEYDVLLTRLLEPAGVDYRKYPVELIEVDEANGNTEELLGAAYLRIGPGASRP